MALYLASSKDFFYDVLVTVFQFTKFGKTAISRVHSPHHRHYYLVSCKEASQ